MIYIKLGRNMSLSITKNEPIYRGDNMSHKIIYLIPKHICDIDTDAAAIYLSYIRADGTADIVLLERLEDSYNETYGQYTFPITCTLTRYAGEVCSWLQIYYGPAQDPVIAKSGECVLHITDSKNMDSYICDRHLSLIYKMQKTMEDRIEKAEAELTERLDKTEEAVAAKADNIIFHPEDSTIQLVSTTTVTDENGDTEVQYLPIGDRIYVRADTSRLIVSMEIDAVGDLIATFDDDTTKNLGRVVGKDGAVYVPHVDDRKILTFTIEDKPGKIPDPVDMDPTDEWSGIDSMNESSTTYVWEKM